MQSAVGLLLRQIVCPSVCPSVTLRYRDHIGWKSSKIISQSVSLGRLLFADPTSWIYSKGNTLWPTVDHLDPPDLPRDTGVTAIEALQLAEDRPFWRTIATAGGSSLTLRVTMMMMMMNTLKF